MSGPIGLHGGGEYVAGDEPFLDALLAAAEIVTHRRAADRMAALEMADLDTTATLDPASEFARDVSGHAFASQPPPIRIVILPTAAARGRPLLAAATGRTAFERRAAASGRTVRVEISAVVDERSAADPAEAERLATADLIHLPGGDPDLIPNILAGSPALAAIERAWAGGAVLAGASAGAMALAEWTWTAHGGIRGLGFVQGVAVVPHYDDVRRTSWQETLDELAPGGIGYLGLDERTGVLSVPNGPDRHAWRVAGAGAVSWFARGAREPLIGRHGDVLQLPV